MSQKPTWKFAQNTAREMCQDEISEHTVYNATKLVSQNKKDKDFFCGTIVFKITFIRFDRMLSTKPNKQIWQTSGRALKLCWALIHDTYFQRKNIKEKHEFKTLDVFIFF